MEISISDADARTLRLDHTKKQRIANLVHDNIGLASCVEVDLTRHPTGVVLATATGAIAVTRDFIRVIE